MLTHYNYSFYYLVLYCLKKYVILYKWSNFLFFFHKRLHNLQTNPYSPHSNLEQEKEKEKLIIITNHLPVQDFPKRLLISNKI